MNIKRLLLFVFISFAMAFQAFSQCPVAISCTPGGAPASAFPFGMGIFNVAVGSGASGFTNASGGVSEGYMNFSCTKKATVAENVATSISITTNPNVNENVRVWIDLNNNGVFDAVSELVFSSNNAKVHTGTFTIPTTAIKNTVLRMRISADNFSSPIPTPCSTPAYSQAEDYGITVVQNLNKPDVDFSVNNPVTCSPTVQFQNLVQNGATTYFWSFGDNTTSTAANPAHTYAATGTYTVKLKACNANGCDSLTKTNYVTYHTNTPVAATCSPITSSYCCGYGITKVTFHTMVNTSANGFAGYQDFTCSKSVTVQEAGTYPIALETGTANSQDSWIYIDYNNNGQFEPSELAFTSLNSFNPSGNIAIQSNTVTNTPLRMRVISDVQGSQMGPCVNRTSGQVEDYTVITTPNSVKPAPNFTSNFFSICSPNIQFTNTTIYGATSYEWDFGDGSPKSTQINPQHTYTANGSYTVKLKACNAAGCDSIAKLNFVTINQPCPVYCIPFYNSSTSFGLIYNVTLNTLNHNSGADPNAYGNYTAAATTLTKNTSYQFSSNTDTLAYRTVRAWIDYNQDGDFYDLDELIASGSQSGPINRTFKVPTTAKPGVTRMRVMAGGGQFNPCSDSRLNLETKDYSIFIVPNNQPPIAYFNTTGHTVTYCNPTVGFTDDGSENTPTSWQWNFGDPASGAANTSTLQNPRHTFSSPGTYTITLIVCNPFGCDTLTRPNHITITGNTGPQAVTCRPITIFPDTDIGLFNFSFNTINHSSAGGESYRDYSCTQQTTVSAGQSYPVTVQNGPYYPESIKIWIDYNNNALFDTSEVVFTAYPQKQHSGSIAIPPSAVFNVPLRMRVMSGIITIHQSLQPCADVQKGETADYSVTILNPLGTTENKLAQAINIYPNPGSGIFYLENAPFLKGDFRLQVYNTTGQLLAEVKPEIESGRQRFDLSQLQNGIYIIKASSSEFSIFKKIIIEH